MTEDKRTNTRSSGNALFAVFGAVVLVGLLGAGVNNFIRGPLNTAIKQTRVNSAKAQMLMTAQLAVMSATTSVSTPEAKVFVTSDAGSANLGGLNGADTRCQNLANTAGLTGNFKAWLADGTASPDTRFTKLNIPYKLVNGVTIANNWADLTDGTLAAPIRVTELGTDPAANNAVFTNTNPNGTTFSPTNHCSNWSIGNGDPVRSGDRRQTDSTWSVSTDSICSNGIRLYCFQQDAPLPFSGGDCDSDGVVEPLEFRPAGALPAPVGGGLVPAAIGLSPKDPWGTEYGYCVWDYGSVSLGNACQQDSPGTNRRLAGHATATNTPVVAVISAGPDKKFTTTCRSYAAADLNGNGVLTDANEPPLVSKAAVTDDDVILAYSHLDIANMTGGLWAIKSSNANVAISTKNIEAQEAKFTGAGLFQKLAASGADFVDIVSGLRLPSVITANICSLTNKFAMRRNASSNDIEGCDGTAWVPAVGSGGGSGPVVDIPPATQNIVFVTSSTYSGNLGGLTGADMICQRHANSAGLPGKYMAWLGDPTDSPRIARFYQSTVPYKLVDGTTIANNWADLIDSTLAAPINKTETGATLNTGVWTDVMATGHFYSPSGHCAYWTSSLADPIITGRTGSSSVTDATWTYNTSTSSQCNIQRALYCFQQTEAATGGGGGSSAGAFDGLSDALTNYAESQFFGGTGSGLLSADSYENNSWGYQNFTALTTAKSNTAFGTEALKSLTTGRLSAGFGYQAMMNVQDGGDNVVIGSQAGLGITSGTQVTGVGYKIMPGAVTSGANIVLGAEALGGGNDSVALGYRSLFSNTTGGNNVAAGINSLYNTTTGGDNTAMGREALRANTTGTQNTAIGANAMLASTLPDANTALGYYSLASNLIGVGNVALGSESSRYTRGDHNTSAGYLALKGASGLSTGSGNTAIGAYSMTSNTTGAENTGVGYQTLKANTTGNYNVAVGYDALVANTKGSNNTAVGTEALKSLAGGGTSRAADCTGLGAAFSNDNISGHCYWRTSASKLVADAKLDCTSQGGYLATVTSAAENARLNSIGVTVTWLGGSDSVVEGKWVWEDGPEQGLQFWNGPAASMGGTSVGGAYTNWGSNGGTDHPVAANDAMTLATSIGGTWIASDGDFGMYQAFCEKDPTSGSDHTAFGWNALTNQTGGIGSTAVGYAAGAGVAGFGLGGTSKHTFIGAGTQAAASPSDDGVTAIGYNALNRNAGAGNTAIGATALQGLTTGSYNTGIGYGAAMSSVSPTKTASHMTAIGSLAAANANGDNVTAIGYKALQDATGSNNTAIGDQSGQGVTTGAYNTLVGDQAGFNLTTASHNTLVGYRAGYTNTTTDFITAVGYQALYYNTGEYNTAMGYQALYNNTVGGSNTAIGYAAMQANTIGSYNTAYGTEALTTQTGTAADCAGLGAAYYNDPLSGHCYYKTSATNNWGGQNAACKANGDYLANITSDAEVQIVLNNLALTAADSYYFTGATDSEVEGAWRYMGGPEEGMHFWQGNQSGAAVNSNYNNWFAGDPNGGTAENCKVPFWNGVWVWVSADCTQFRRAICERDPSEASYNTAIGRFALNANTTGSGNTAVGYNALVANTTGSNNTAVGYAVMANNTTGSNNTAIGNAAGPASAALTNTTAIGNGAVVTVSDAIRVGNDSVTSITGQVTFTATSDARVKKDIAPSDLGLDFIMGLKPVSYRLKQGNGRLDYGFLAQDIEASLDGRVTNMIIRRNDEMKTYQLRASDLLAPLVKALQEQDDIIVKLQAKIDAIKKARQIKACDKNNAEGKDDPTL